MENYGLDHTEGNNRKITFAIIAILAIGILAIAGYYLLKKGDSGSPFAGASPSLAPSSLIDSDFDSIPDTVEKAIGTNPDKMDTDSDTYFDLDEIKSGYSPIIAGAAGKYTPEALQSLKDKIKAADEKFYIEEFGASGKLADWKKYQSDDFWFEIYYPKDWVFNYPADRINYMEFKKPEPGQEKISLTFYENSEAFGLANSSSLEDYYKKSPIVEKKEIVFFGQKEFQKVIVHDCPRAGGSCTRYYLVNNGHIYQFEYEIENSAVNEIISTFKIIE